MIECFKIILNNHSLTNLCVQCISVDISDRKGKLYPIYIYIYIYIPLRKLRWNKKIDKEVTQHKTNNSKIVLYKTHETACSMLFSRRKKKRRVNTIPVDILIFISNQAFNWTLSLPHYSISMKINWFFDNWMRLIRSSWKQNKVTYL